MNLDELIEQLKSQGIHNAVVLSAIRKIPRESFVLAEYRHSAYDNIPLPIEKNQTISQPYVIAKMTEVLLETGAMENVLEIGTGSGYQSAILAQLSKHLYSVERIETLHLSAKKRFEKLNITNIECRHGDGYLGWPEHAPYDAIMVTAATSEVPQALIDQLNDGGRLIVPVGDENSQILLLITKKQNATETTFLDPVRFVPLLHGME